MKKVIVASILCMAFLAGGLMSRAFAWEKDTNRPGHDYQVVDVYSLEECANRCKNEQQCQSFTAVIPQNLQQSGGAGKCHLKDAVPPPISDKCCISGLKPTVSPFTPLPPPIPGVQKGQVINQDAKTTDPNQTGSQNIIQINKTPVPSGKIPQVTNKDTIPLNPNEKVVSCPLKITIDNIKTKPPDQPGFIGQSVGNMPATFTYSIVGQDSSTKCWCWYKLGSLDAIIKVNLDGYASCKPNLPTDSIILYK
jgi:hypothetical protein